MFLQRLLCANEESCSQRSHSLLPDVLVSGRCDLASVVGWALEANAVGVGFRPIAGQLGVPAATVRGWLRAAAVTGQVTARRLWAVAAAADPAVRDPPTGAGVAVLVASARVAASSWSWLSGEPVGRWRFAVRHVGGRLLG